MIIIQCTQTGQIAAPVSVRESKEMQIWLDSMSDSGWRVLTDFRNWSIWMPGVLSAAQVDTDPPARGTELIVDSGRGLIPCFLEHWEPPRNLQISITLTNGEIAYGIKIEPKLKSAEIRFSVQLERSLTGLARIVSPYFRWRLQKQGRSMLTNILAATKETSKP